MKMKKMLSLLFVVVLCIGLMGCGNSSKSVDSGKEQNSQNASEDKDGDSAETSTSDHKKFKIGILEVQLNDESAIRVNYFNDYIGPRYNCEFMFSEACTTLDAAMTFVENAADAGCDAIINYYAVGANTDQLIQLCQEYGMVYCENSGQIPANAAAYSAGYENFGGGFQADQPATGKLFYDYLSETMEPDASHNFIIGTGAAYQGNTQQTEISTNMLEAIAEIYDLKYDATIEELITSSSPINATNDKGVEIYCYPGGPNEDGWLEGMSAALQTGTYDYLLLASQALGNVGNVVSEVEEALDKDITIIGFGSFGDALTNAFNTKDRFGNTTCSMSTVKFTSLVSAMGFSEVYNLLTGHPEVVTKENGEAGELLFRMQSVTSPEQLEDMSGWDTTDNWVADYDIVDGFLAEYSDGLTYEQIQERIFDVTYESIKERLD